MARCERSSTRRSLAALLVFLCGATFAAADSYHSLFDAKPVQGLQIKSVKRPNDMAVLDVMDAPYGNEIEMSFVHDSTVYAYNMTLLPSVFEPDAEISIDGVRTIPVPPRTSYRATFVDSTGSEGFAAVTLHPADGSLYEGIVASRSSTLQLQPTARMRALGALSYEAAESFTTQGHSIAAFSQAATPLSYIDADGAERPYMECGVAIAETGASGTEPAAVAPFNMFDGDEGADGADGARKPLLQKWTNCFSGGPKRFRILMGVSYGATALIGDESDMLAYVSTVITQSNLVYIPQVDIMMSLSRLLICTSASCTDANGPTKWNVNGTACPQNATASPGILAYTDDWRNGSSDNKKNGAAHVLTSCYPPPGVVGLAYIATAAKKEFAAGWSQVTASTWATFAHEIGHNLGAPHPFDAIPNSKQGQYGGLMDYVPGGLLLANDSVNPLEPGFNTASDKNTLCVAMNKSMNDLSSTFITPRSDAWVSLNTGTVCGNGIVEPGEECDAGSGGNACCTTQCKYTAGSRCGEVNGQCCKNCQPEPDTTQCTASFGSKGFCGPRGQCATSSCQAWSLAHCGIKANPCEEKCARTDGTSCGANWQDGDKKSIVFSVPAGAQCTVPSTGAPGRCHSSYPLRPSVATTCQELTYTASIVGAYGNCVCPAGSSNGVKTAPFTCLEQGLNIVAASLCQAPTQDCQCEITDPYSWKTSAWGSCSANTCIAGGGTQTRTVTCVRTSDSTTAPEANCLTYGSKPEASQKCTRECTYEWKCAAPGAAASTAGSCAADAQFGACSNTCGSGTKTRQIFCRDQFGVAADESRCSAASAPATSTTCSSQTGCTWRCRARDSDAFASCSGSATFGACSANCGAGNQTRTVACTANTKDVVSNSWCTGSPPGSSQACSGSGCVNEWYCGENGAAASTFQVCDAEVGWGVCDATCGKGSRARDVVCRNQAGQSSSACSDSGKPASTSTCTSVTGCTFQYQWMCGATAGSRAPCDENSGWTGCTGSCGAGTGVQTRTVTCVGENNTVASDETCAAAGLSKPASVRGGCTRESLQCQFAWRCYAPGSSNILPCSDFTDFARPDFGPCPTTCTNSATQRIRRVACFDVSNVSAGGDPFPVAESMCPAISKPSTTGSCQEDNSKCEWAVLSDWTGCPACVEAGAPTPDMTRTVSCMGQGNSFWSKVDDAKCTAPRPARQQACPAPPVCASLNEPQYKWVSTPSGSGCTGDCVWGVETNTVTCCRYYESAPSACTTVSNGYCPSASRPSDKRACIMATPKSGVCSGRGSCTTSFTDFVSRFYGVCTCNPEASGSDCSTVASLTNVTFTTTGALPQRPARGDTITISWSYSGSSWAGAATRHVIVTLVGSAPDGTSVIVPVGSVPSSVTKIAWEVPAGLRVLSSAKFRVSASRFLAADSDASFEVRSVCADVPGFCGAYGSCDSDANVDQLAPCTCNSPYVGSRCTEIVCLAAGCNPRSDASAGCSVISSDNILCHCKSGFGGDRCYTPTTCPTASNPDEAAALSCNHGTRIATSTGTCGPCACDGDWSGANCNTCSRRCAGNAVSGVAGSPTADCKSCQCTPGFTGERCQCRGVAVALSFAASRLPPTLIATAASRADYFGRMALELNFLAQSDLQLSSGSGTFSFVRSEDYPAGGKRDERYIKAWFHLHGYCAQINDADPGVFVVTADGDGASTAYVGAAHAAASRLIDAVSGSDNTALSTRTSLLADSGFAERGIYVNDPVCAAGDGCPSASGAVVPGENDSGSGKDGLPGWAIAVIVVGAVVGVIFFAFLLRWCCVAKQRATAEQPQQQTQESNSIERSPGNQQRHNPPPAAPQPPRAPPQFQHQQQQQQQQHAYGSPPMPYGNSPVQPSQPMSRPPQYPPPQYPPPQQHQVYGQLPPAAPPAYNQVASGPVPPHAPQSAHYGYPPQQHPPYGQQPYGQQPQHGYPQAPPQQPGYVYPPRQ